MILQNFSGAKQSIIHFLIAPFLMNQKGFKFWIHFKSSVYNSNCGYIYVRLHTTPTKCHNFKTFDVNIMHARYEYI